MYPKPYSPLTLQQRINAYADQVKIAKARAAQCLTDMRQAYEQLMAAEAEVIGKAHGWEGVTLSGLVPEGKNKYAGGSGESEPLDVPAPPRPVAEVEVPPAAPADPAPMEAM